MRKPRDFDSELKALADKAKALKERRIRQLGELVAATGADALEADLLAGVLLDAIGMKNAATREGWRERARPSFATSNASLRRDLTNSRKALYRSKAARHRIEARKARTDMREWMVKRRERTRLLIELGGLVVKAGLVDLTDDDRSTLYGALLAVAGKLQGKERDHALALWQRRGKRAFEAEANTKTGRVGDHVDLAPERD